MSNKLYELLAVEQDRKNKANKAIGLCKNTLNQKSDSFDGMVKHYVSLEEDAAEQIPDETKESVTTVKDLLMTHLDIVISAVDANLSKEETNSANVAKAELVVENTSFGDFSATALLALETHLGKLLEMYQAIPVLDHTKKWEFDDQTGVYKTDTEVKFRSVKRPKVIVKYEATEQHPAQTDLLYLDFQIGKYETTYFSGKITSVQKATLISRLEKLTEAVKIARSRANNVEVKQVKVGEKLVQFLHNGIF